MRCSLGRWHLCEKRITHLTEVFHKTDQSADRGVKSQNRSKELQFAGVSFIAVLHGNDLYFELQEQLHNNVHASTAHPSDSSLLGSLELNMRVKTGVGKARIAITTELPRCYCFHTASLR